MRLNILILLALFSGNTFLFGQSYHKVAQYNMGRLLPTDTIHFKVEYPEYVKLSRKDIHKLRAEGFTPTNTIQFNQRLSKSRGETWVEVDYIPVVVRNNNWYEACNYKLTPYIKGVKLSSAVRKVMRVSQIAQSASRYAAHSVLATGKWVKIGVTKEGIYQLTDAQLKKAGFTDPSKVKLYGYGGRLIAENFKYTGTDALIDDLNEVPLYRRNGSVLFFAEGLDRFTNGTQFTRNVFSKYGYYFLTESDGNQAPASFETLASPTNTTANVTTALAHSLIKNEAFSWYGGGRDLFDSHDLQSSYTFTLPLPGNNGSSYQIAYCVSGTPGSKSSTFYIHDNDGNSADISRSFGSLGEEEVARGYRSTFNSKTDKDQAKFSINTPSTGHLGYLHAIYTQNLSASNPTNSFSPYKQGAVSIQVSNADANTRVWQLGDAESAIAQLPGSLNGTTYNASASDGNKRFVIVDVSKSYDSPTIVGNIANQDLHADSTYDYIIIVPESGKLTAQAERLAQLHRDVNHLRVKVVRADQLYNEFSSGTPDASAYRRYIKMLYDRAASMDDAPRYLLLMGNCSFDNRMLTTEWKSQKPEDYLLAYERSAAENTNGAYGIGSLNDYVTDDYYALLDDGEGTNITYEKIDLGVGRFLCSTEAEAKHLVDQVERYIYNQRPGAWKNKMWAIGDVGDNNLHMTDAQGVCNQVTTSANEGFMLRRINPDAYSVTYQAQGATFPEATSKITRAMQTGALIFNYNGHGSPDRLSRTFLLNKSVFAENKSESLPLWIFASCEITPYDQAREDIGRNALSNTNGGAIGVLCASRSVFANYNLSLNKGFIKHLFAKDDQGKRNTIGDALRKTKVELISSSSQGNTIGTDYSRNKMKYAYLGDPAVTLAYADEGIFIDSINGKQVEGTAITDIPVGGKVSFSGYVNGSNANSADASFSGTLYATIYAPKQTITCKGYANTTANNFVYSDYTQTLFEGMVKVNKGRFNIETIIPRGTTFSPNACLLSLYAESQDSLQSFNGRFDKFCVNSSVEPAEADTLGPKVYLYADTPDFPDGGIISPSSTFYASVADSSGISMLSGNLGHDMELWFDGNTDQSIVVNDYFTFNFGSFTDGTLQYPLNDIALGKHTATLRVWDVFGNSTTSTLNFRMQESANTDKFNVVASTVGNLTRFITTYPQGISATGDSEIETEVYNLTGMRVWHKSYAIQAGYCYGSVDWDQTDYAGAPLPAGVYLYRSKVGKEHTSTQKFIVK